MAFTNRYSVIIIGAGISGITVAMELSENGVDDVVILEATDRIGGRIRKETFGGVAVELGAGWIAGVGGEMANPVWKLAKRFGIRTILSDYSNARFNIYNQSGTIYPSRLAAESYRKAVETAMRKLRNEEDDDIDELAMMPKTPIELAIDFILHDFEMAEVEPISTYTEYGEREFMVADERGYEHILYKLAETFLLNSDGKISDHRLQLNKVVREVQHSKNGVKVTTEDGSSYEADYLILSVSIGVLQSDLISFRPSLPRWKTEAIQKCDVIVYTKIFLKFPYKFWTCEPGKEFFIFAHERRGYYTFWQHMENAYPGSNILVVTLTNGESKRIEDQSDQQTLKEAMEVLRIMFGPDIPDATDILVPQWWNNQFQRGSYTNYPIVNNHIVHDVKAHVERIFFTGEHTSEKFSGFVHGGYLSGIDTAKDLLEEMKLEKERTIESKALLLALSESLSISQTKAASNGYKYEIPRQVYLGSNLGAPEAIL